MSLCLFFRKITLAAIWRTGKVLGVEKPECQSAKTNVLAPEDSKADFVSQNVYLL